MLQKNTHWGEHPVIAAYSSLDGSSFLGNIDKQPLQFSKMLSKMPVQRESAKEHSI